MEGWPVQLGRRKNDEPGQEDIGSDHLRVLDLAIFCPLTPLDG